MSSAHRASGLTLFRESGIAWAGLIPAHWETGPIRRYAAMKTGHTPDRSQPEYWRDCDIPWFTLADVWQLRDDRQTHMLETKERISRLGLQNSAAELLPAGTVVFSRTASIGFSGIMPQPMATTQDFWNWVPGPRLLSEYLLQAFRAMRPEFERLAFGSTHRTIYQPEAADLRICVPTLDEQRSIAAYLERGTARLDALVAAKERVLGLLAEKRRAFITGAVTRGLDPAAPLRDSGIPWLGEVPAHWETGPIRRFAAMKTGHTPDRSNPDYWRDCHIPWFALADVWQLRDDRQLFMRETKERISELGLQNSAAELLPAGTVVFSRTASIGFSGMMPEPMATTQDFWNWIPGPKLRSGYLLQAFRAMRPEFERLAFGSTHRTIYQPDAANLRICVPPLPEQDAIVAYIASQTAKLDALRTATERTIALLKERRGALITAAVTGKIDVQGVGRHGSVVAEDDRSVGRPR